MNNLRRYGNSPFIAVVVHGGPGAAGEIAPVARELSSDLGVLEPLQTADSLDGQIIELKSVIKENGDLPIILIGFSWGAWLSYIFTAKYPNLVKKLILISSGPFEEQYVEGIHDTRMSRLNKNERSEVTYLFKQLNNPTTKEKNNIFKRFGAIFTKSDSYDPIPNTRDDIIYNFDIFHNVWKDAFQIRKTGTLLTLGNIIKCPVVAIHGDYDSHPADGVEKPLSKLFSDFQFYLLKNCGHKPWVEKQAKAEFYQILREEII